MRRIRKAWPARVAAAMTALAVILAPVFAGYAHAAGHRHSAGHSSGHVAQSAAALGSHAEEGPEEVHAGHVHTGHGHAGHGHGVGDTGTSGSGADTCSVLCTGGFAILVATPLIEHPLATAPAAEPAVSIAGAEPSGLERPPKASVPA
jgi:hypothetical protein